MKWLVNSTQKLVIKIILLLMINLKKILNLTPDPIIIQTLLFIIKCLKNGVHKMFLKHSIINGFRTHYFLTFAKRFLQMFANQKCLLG